MCKAKGSIFSAFSILFYLKFSFHEEPHRKFNSCHTLLDAIEYTFLSVLGIALHLLVDSILCRFLDIMKTFGEIKIYKFQACPKFVLNQVRFTEGDHRSYIHI